MAIRTVLDQPRYIKLLGSQVPPASPQGGMLDCVAGVLSLAYHISGGTAGPLHLGGGGEKTRDRGLYSYLLSWLIVHGHAWHRKRCTAPNV